MRHESAKRHILVVVHPGGGYDPQIRTRPRFLCNAPTLQVSSSYVFTRLEVTVLTHKSTNKQTPTKTSNILGYATTLGKQNQWVRNPRRAVPCGSQELEI